MLSNTLMQVPACETNITCIAQVTFKIVNKALLVHHWWLKFPQFKISFNLVTHKNRLNGDLNFLAQVLEQLQSWGIF